MDVVCKQVFQSHCAPEDDAMLPPEKMPVARLKAELSTRGLPLSGRKPALVAALRAALDAVALDGSSIANVVVDHDGAAVLEHKAGLTKVNAAAVSEVAPYASIAPPTPQQHPRARKRRRAAVAPPSPPLTKQVLPWL